MTQPFEKTFILFADMLGFAALVEREGDELNELNPIFTGVDLYSPSPAEACLDTALSIFIVASIRLACASRRWALGPQLYFPTRHFSD